MRAFALLSVLLVACTSSAPVEPTTSMRDRLTEETHLFAAAAQSAGAVTVRLRTASGWHDVRVDLKLASGELVTQAAPGGAIALIAAQVELQPIEIPASLTGHAAALTRPRLVLTAPASAAATWSGDDSAALDVPLALQLSWSLAVDGIGVQVGAPALPPLPAQLVLTGDGVHVAAELRIQAPGPLWGWADRIELSDLELVLDADTASP